MTNPRKPANQKKGKSETKAQLSRREEMEKKIGGEANTIYDVPETLSPIEKFYYGYIVNELKASGILSNLDFFAVEKTAKILSALDECEQLILDYGRVYEIEDRSGNPQLKDNPAVKQHNAYLNQFRAMFNQLGLSPSGRAHLAGLALAKTEEEEDEIAKLMN